MKKPTLNIISNSYGLNKTGGPNKVILNTIKGLEQINYPFVINKSIKNYRYNWIHDSIEGVIAAAVDGIPALFGPNIVVLPKNLPYLLPDISNSIYLHPSQWCIDVWKELNYNKSKTEVWPVGIDTDEFKINRHEVSDPQTVLVYYKRRDPELLNSIVEAVKRKGLKPEILKYGSYSESEYKDLLKKASFGIWLTISESQGIALQEALASNLPLIVFDISSLRDSNDKADHLFPEYLPVTNFTSAPYFDETCGLKIKKIEELDMALDFLTKNINIFRPRDFICGTLSLENQAKKLITFFDEIESKSPLYFKGKAFSETPNDFKLPLKGHLIYYNFLTKRKAKTFVRIIKSL